MGPKKKKKQESSDESDYSVSEQEVDDDDVEMGESENPKKKEDPRKSIKEYERVFDDGFVEYGSSYKWVNDAEVFDALQRYSSKSPGFAAVCEELRNLERIESVVLGKICFILASNGVEVFNFCKSRCTEWNTQELQMHWHRIKQLMISFIRERRVGDILGLDFGEFEEIRRLF
jgi:hypothetical protein